MRGPPQRSAVPVVSRLWQLDYQRFFAFIIEEFDDGRYTVHPDVTHIVGVRGERGC